MAGTTVSNVFPIAKTPLGNLHIPVTFSFFSVHLPNLMSREIRHSMIIRSVYLGEGTPVAYSTVATD